MKYCYFYQTELGRVGIQEEGSMITHIYFDGENPPADVLQEETELLKEAGKQLQEYLAGERTEFSLPLSARGTAFMERVWEGLCTIPYGETRSYRDIAEAIGNPKACRAVGMANNRNPIPIFIPCHRVIGANGTLTGYGGGLAIKEHLLQLERQKSGQVQ
ncbi:methylated-DNA--[protein]-cysteine S-methyltransferase [Bacillus testis]|uniref:methylated-DNA--[protein]-cysteine S-methyltransferase n=1 Tax=Bacillus testis TaxID=1622072 RepID=UPI00067F3FF1|nr:methylated-DNA--[protein]-cysteine S-methyltransferase [Bacillus testis]